MAEMLKNVRAVGWFCLGSMEDDVQRYLGVLERTPPETEECVWMNSDWEELATISNGQTEAAADSVSREMWLIQLRKHFLISDGVPVLPHKA